MLGLHSPMMSRSAAARFTRADIISNCSRSSMCEFRGGRLDCWCGCRLVFGQERHHAFKYRRLKLEVKKSFYKGTLMSVDDAIKFLARADIANLCGNNIVSAVVEKGFADPRAVIWISDTPHLQFIKM